MQLNGHLQQQDGVEIKFMDGNIDGHVDSNLTLTESLHNDEESRQRKAVSRSTTAPVVKEKVHPIVIPLHVLQLVRASLLSYFTISK